MSEPMTPERLASIRPWCEGYGSFPLELINEVDRLRAQVAAAWDGGEESGRENADDGYPDPLIENPYRAALASGDEVQR